MNITNERPVMIFANDYQGTRYYKVGLSKKDKDGNYVNGYMPCRFKRGVELNNQTKIMIKNAWLDFYLDKDNKTNTQIFINEYELVENNDNMELPF